MKEARIGLRDQLNRLNAIGDSSRLQHHPQVAGALRKRMVADARATRYLVIDKLTTRIYLFHQFVQKIFQFLFGTGHFNFKKLSAVEETINMLIDRKYLIVARWTSVVHAIAKPMNAIVHWDAHFIQGAEFPVVVAQVFHVGNSFINQ